jgi:Domain of unknown function (DUF4262)
MSGMDTFTPRDEYMFQIAGTIHRHGFFIQYVLGDRGHPPWAYTIGLAARGVPEFVVMGIDAESASFLLHRVHDDVTAGRPIRIGRDRRHAIGGIPVRFLRVLDDYLDVRLGLFGTAEGYNASTVGWPWTPRFLQVVWAAENRALPWSARYPARLRRLQPLLDVPGAFDTARPQRW